MGAKDESGFSMIEVAVTIGILGVIVVSMTAALGNGFKFLLHAKQRAAATQAANAMIERARAIGQSDWSQLGLVSSDMAGDPAIVAGSCGGVPASMFSGEPVVAAGTTTSNPLYPHVRTTAIGSTTVTLRTYVTGVSAFGGCSATNPTYKRVTVVASWARPPSGVPSTLRIATFLSPVTRPANPDFAGVASYSSGALAGHFDPASGVPTQAGIFPPSSTADGRSVGQVVTYKGAGISTLGQIDGAVSTATASAETTADDDALTAGIPRHACDPATCATPPDCSSFAGVENWSAFLGGLSSTTLAGTVSSCSSVAGALDGLPVTINRASMTSPISIVSTVPAGGILPSFPVGNILTSSQFATTSSVDRANVTGLPTLSSIAEATIPTTKMLSFKIPGVINVPDGVVQLDGATYSARANAGVGAATPSVTGVMRFRLYDPNDTITGCTREISFYCTITIDPSLAGFSGLDRTFAVTIDVPTLLPTARFAMITSIKAFVPSSATSSSAGAITQATMSYALPVIETSLLVSSPVGVTLATVSDTMDFGRLVTAASYAPAP